MKKLFTIFVLLTGIAFTHAAQAASPADIGTVSSPWLSSSTTVLEFIAKVINWISGIAGAFAVLAIIYGGFQYITAGGDTAKSDAAKKTLTWAILGLIICALAFLIVQFVIKIF